MEGDRVDKSTTRMAVTFVTAMYRMYSSYGSYNLKIESIHGHY